MNCNRCSRLLDDYLLARLPEPVKGELEEHLGACRNCQQQMEAVRRVHDALSAAPGPVDAREWEAFEGRVWGRLQAELAEPARAGLWPRLLSLLRPAGPPRPRLAFALSMAIVVAASVTFALFWLATSHERIASDTAPLYPLWLSQTEQSSVQENQVASLIQGVDRILAEENGEELYTVDTDSMLDALVSESDLDVPELDDVVAQTWFPSAWSLGDAYEAEALDASKEELESAIRVVLSTENGS